MEGSSTRRLGRQEAERFEEFLPFARGFIVGELLLTEMLQCRSCGAVGMIAHIRSKGRFRLMLYQFSAVESDGVSDRAYYRDVPDWQCVCCESTDVRCYRTYC